MGDKLHGSPPPTGFQDFYGVKTIKGQHHFFCLGDTPLNAELISSEVLYHLIHFTPEIRKHFCIEKFEVTSLGALSRVEEAHTEFVVPITVTYQHLLQWSLDRQAPEWKRLAFNVNTVSNQET